MAVQQIRETLNGSYDDLKGRKIKRIPATLRSILPSDPESESDS
jgi:hypothetical protein